MHYVQAKSILSPQGGMNLYRGCTHGCIYCDSRSLCYRMTHPFEDVAVKANAPQLLEEALRRKRKKCMIATGSMSDPYLPLEKTEGLTRKCLEIIYRYGFGVSLITKSDLVLRDLDLLTRINQKTRCVVQMTLTTYDEDLCRLVEPRVCSTRRRVEALARLRDAGIPTIVWLCPILPFINDTPDNLRGILDHCFQAGVRGVLSFGMGMTLRAGSREYYYAQLDRHFPGLRQKYVRAFGDSYMCPSPHSQSLNAIFLEACRRHQVMCSPGEIFAWLEKFVDKRSGEQLRLF